MAHIRSYIGYLVASAFFDLSGLGVSIRDAIAQCAHDVFSLLPDWRPDATTSVALDSAARDHDGPSVMRRLRQFRAFAQRGLSHDRMVAGTYRDPGWLAA